MKNLTLLLPLLLPIGTLAESFNTKGFSAPESPDEEVLMRTAINLSEYSLKKTSTLSSSKSDKNGDKDCPDKKQEIETPPPQQEAICFCELTEEEKKRLPFIGKIEAVEYDLITGNDNLLHGGLRLWDKWLPYDGDDRGRTFSIGGNYSLIGSEGELKIGLHSTGFGNLATQDGFKYDPEKKRYLNFLERDTFSLRADKYFNQTENSKNRLIGELHLDYFNDEGLGAQSFQKAWHKGFEGLGMIQYSYRDHMKPKAEVSAFIGFGKDYELDISRFKCQFKAEAKVGISTMSGNPFLASGAVSSKFSHRDIPWLAVTLWAQESKDLFGRESSQGAKINFPIKGKSVVVSPFIGVEKHRSHLDKTYASDPKKASELYHVIGISIRY